MPWSVRNSVAIQRPSGDHTCMRRKASACSVDLLRSANRWLDYEGGALIADAEARYQSGDLGEPVRIHWHDNRSGAVVFNPRRSARSEAR